MNTHIVFKSNDEILSCHSGMLCEYLPEKLIAVWFGGSFESSQNSVIMSSFFSYENEEWTEPRILVNVHGHAAGNPRIFLGPDQAIWLIVPINYGEWCSGGSKLFLKRSFDNGRSWTDLELFEPQYKILGKNKPIVLNNGIWLIPVEFEPASDVCFLRSDNGGKKWDLVNVDSGDAFLDQPTVVQLEDSTLLAYMRSWDGLIFKTTSTDYGKSWTKAEATKLLNNNSGIDLVSLKSKNLVLAHNPTALGINGREIIYGRKDLVPVRYLSREFQDRLTGLTFGDGHIQMEFSKNEGYYNYPAWGPRTPLILSVSNDQGKNWKHAFTLEEGEGEYSYPCIIQDTKGIIHIIYTWNRIQMKHVLLTEEELLNTNIKERIL